MKRSTTRNLGLILLWLCFGKTFALDLKLLLNNETVNPLEYLIPTLNSENEKCRTHSLMYMEELSKFTVWATDMFDATTKFPTGIFFGSNYDTGNFDECIKVHLPENIGFSGQHCMAHFKMKPLSPVVVKQGNVLEFDKYENIFNITTWEKVTKYAQDGSKQSRDEIHFSFCIPSSCTYEDLLQSLRLKIDLLKEVLPVNLEVDLTSRNCQVERDISFTRADKIFMGVVGAFVLFGTICTLYHLLTKLDGMERFQFSERTHQVLKAYSYSHTMKRMASVVDTKDGMDCLHGIKVISMFLIVMGHRIMFSIGSPVGNPIFVEQSYRKLEYSLFLNGPIIVDTFFTISGFLACYLILLELEKRKKMVNVFLLYLHRFIRLTPAYAVVLGFYCTIFVQLGDGPFWEERIRVEQERCVDNWWTNILYINNYVNYDRMCMFQSWYLTCDTHFFLFVPFLAHLLWKKPKLGAIVCSILIAASVVVPFYIIYLNQEGPFLLLYMKVLRDPVSNKYFQNIYIPSHMRVGSYLIGVVGGYLKFKLMQTGYKIPTWIRYPIWVIGVCVSLGIMLTAYLFYIPTEEPDYFFSGVYGSIHHVLWSTSIVGCIIFVSEGYGKWFAPFLNWGPWALLSRITYTTFLSHGAIQLYGAGVIRSPTYTGFFNLFNYTSADIVLAFIAGFFLSLVFESPIMALEKMILRREPQKSNETEPSEEKNGKVNKAFTDIFIPSNIHIPKVTTMYKS